MFEKIRAILWDIDGTLFSSEDILSPSYCQAFVNFQKKNPKLKHIPHLEQLLLEIGKPVKEIFKNLAPELDSQEQDALSEEVLSILVRMIAEGKGNFYPNVEKTLKNLYQHGYKFFSASNGRYPYIEAILEKSGTLKYFKEIRTLDNIKIHDKVDLVKAILKENKILPEEALLIGDRQTDRDAAIYNDVAFVATAYGHGEEREWKDASLVIQDLADLEKHLIT